MRPIIRVPFMLAVLTAVVLGLLVLSRILIGRRFGGAA